MYLLRKNRDDGKKKDYSFTTVMGLNIIKMCWTYTYRNFLKLYKRLWYNNSDNKVLVMCNIKKEQ